MTDAEIMKGVKLCNGDLGNCKECPFDSIGKTCGIELAKAEIGLIERLQAENAALRERLEKAVELKVKIEDTVFMPWTYDGVFGIAELQVCAIHFLYDGSIIYSTDLDTDNDIGFLSKYSYGNFLQEEFGSRIFNNPEAAEARLRELQGGKE